MFNVSDFPWKGKRYKNGHKDKHGGHYSFRRDLRERSRIFPEFSDELGRLEGDTIVGAHHKTCVSTLVERQSKLLSLYTLKEPVLLISRTR